MFLTCFLKINIISTKIQDDNNIVWRSILFFLLSPFNIFLLSVIMIIYAEAPVRNSKENGTGLPSNNNIVMIF